MSAIRWTAALAREAAQSATRTAIEAYCDGEREYARQQWQTLTATAEAEDYDSEAATLWAGRADGDMGWLREMYTEGSIALPEPPADLPAAYVADWWTGAEATLRAWVRG